MKYTIKQSYRNAFRFDYFEAAFNANAAVNRGDQVIIDPRDTPLRVSLAMATEKITSYAKEQAFPKALIDAAIKAYEQHGKKVLIVVSDTDFLPKNDAVAGVVSEKLCRNFTKEKENTNHHGSLCLGSLAAIHKLYAGTLQPLFEIGAVEFAFDKVMRNGFGTSGEILAGMKAQTPRDGFGMTIYSNSWGSINPINSQLTVINNLAAKAGNVAHIFAAGNAGKIGDSVDVDKVSYPAAYPYTISAGSINEDKHWSPFSSPGPMLDFAIAGEQCLSVDRSGNPSLWNGTSQSCPYLSGLAAILYLLNPAQYNTHVAIKSGLQAACVDLDALPAVTGKDNYTGHGLPWLLSLVDDDHTEPVMTPPDFVLTNAKLQADPEQLQRFFKTGLLTGVSITGNTVVD